ncbi:hypothetical protein [Pseudomonas sp. C2B4]|uniref:hypothetical protein n=1 Tax=Pseudomonas sp. C2B4 TaxID=2735270 RepID=UPI001586041B|nr:hypothetical protein [Pseudomonas sp. C2B4]NUU39447.1 hypothetical protein [Pseudomonas sp. C2B4]
MSQFEFSVHLGGGLYMNSQGVLSHGPEPGKPVYPTPGGGLPIQPDALAKAFQGIAKALPNRDDPKSRQKFDKILDGIGMAAGDKEDLIGALQAVGSVASLIGSVVPIVGAALAVLTLLLGLFKEGPSALELLITRRFDELARKVKALEIQIQQRDLRTQRNVISAALAEIKNYLVEIKNTPPDQATLLLRQQDVRNQLNNAGLAVRNLLDSSTWLATFDRSEYQHVWPWISNRLFTFPVSGGQVPAWLPPQGANRFDHRLMVPLVTFAVTGYLTVLRAAVPEFRSTRQKREDLWDFAIALEVLAENMRREGLARTVYTAADFEGGAAGGLPWGLDPSEVVDFSAFGIAPYLAPDNTRFQVGAFDLFAHNDAFFTPQFKAGSFQYPGPENARQGLLDVRWIPPARLEHYDEIDPVLGWEPANKPPPTRRRYRITNPAECASAANAVAEQNYVDLLYSSGYLNLIHLVATLRNEATDPDHSQTVSSKALLRQRPGAGVSVMVESQPILMTGVISARAERRPVAYKAITWFTTQPLGRERTLRYRVWLRTLSANYSVAGGSWDNEQNYTNYHQVGYINDPERPGFKMLSTSTGVALSEIQLAEGTSSAAPRDMSSTVTMKAITFDWWIPVQPLPVAVSPSEAVLQASLRSVGVEAGGGSTTAPLPSPIPAIFPHTLSNAAIVDAISLQDNDQLTDVIGWGDGHEPPSGQHRLAVKQDVQFDYSLHWQADRLIVSIKNNRAADRNYVVYVVVEEILGSGEVLHTVERVPITGQLTYVPQSYFDKEFAAQAKTAKFFRDFAVHYSKSLRNIPRPGGPGDPDPDDWHAGLLGVDPEVVLSDPVLSVFHLKNFTEAADFAAFSRVILGHPPAARIFRQLLNDTRISETMLMATMESSATAALEQVQREDLVGALELQRLDHATEDDNLDGLGPVDV